MVFIVEVRQGVQVVREERVGSVEAAQAIARDWASKGFSVRITTTGGIPYGF